MGERIERVLVTGAAGVIGRALVPALAERFEVKATDLVGGDGIVVADLRDARAIEGVVAGCDAIVHLGGIANEHRWEEIAAVNIGGTQAVFEAAKKAGARRVIFASSVHAVGMYPRALLGVDVVPRPDTFYGVSKVAGEALGRLYAEKWGLEVACLRIASYQERPRDRRHLSTWLSPGDMVRLVSACLEAPTLSPVAPQGFCVLNAISANTRRWMDDSGWADVGYTPLDDAEVYAAEVAHLHGPEDEISEQVQGGFFAAADYRGLAGDAG